jgi:hypothetical protein
VLGHQVEGLLHAGEHAEREHIDLHELERVDIVLVPLDHLAIDQRGRLDRHEVVEPVVRQDEAAGMLTEVARRAHQSGGPDPRELPPKGLRRRDIYTPDLHIDSIKVKSRNFH